MDIFKAEIDTYGLPSGYIFFGDKTNVIKLANANVSDLSATLYIQSKEFST